MTPERQREIALRALEDCLERLGGLQFEAKDVMVTQLELFTELLEDYQEETKDD